MALSNPPAIIPILPDVLPANGLIVLKAVIQMPKCFRSVDAIIEPYSRTQDSYQSYYRNSIAAYCSGEGIAYSEVGSPFPSLLRLLRRVRDSGRMRWFLPQRLRIVVVDGLANRLGAVRDKPDCAVGCYMFHLKHTAVKVCIDAHDSPPVTRPDLLEWSDLYFKTNFWPEWAYPAKVRPLANVNPLVFENRGLLKALRPSGKEFEIFAAFRIWGGADEVEGVEHNLRLLETLARVKCRKWLLAYLISGDIKSAAVRLDKVGIPWTTEWIPRTSLWRLAARSRLNIVRHGMHQCIPWRMTDILAMGGCPVLDYTATTCWHVPLRDKVHYLNLGVPYRPNQPASFDSDAVVDRVEEWLSSEELTRIISRNAAEYFDECLTPEVLGRYIVSSAAGAARASGAE